MAGPVLPLAHLIEHGIGDPADQVGRDVDRIELARVTLNLAYRHAVVVDFHRPRVEPSRKPSLQFALG